MIILDIGCGYNTEYSQSRGNINMDIEKPDCRIDNFVQADAHNLPFKAEAFNRVFFCEIIEHVENPSACLREIHRVLENMGSVFVSTPQPYLLRKILRVALGLPLRDGNVEHIALWTELEMRNLLRNSGFSRMMFSYGTFQKEHAVKSYTHWRFDRVVSVLFHGRPLGCRSLVVCAWKIDS